MVLGPMVFCLNVRCHRGLARCWLLLLQFVLDFVTWAFVHDVIVGHAGAEVEIADHLL